MNKKAESEVVLVKKRKLSFSGLMAKPEFTVALALIALIVLMCILRPQTFPTVVNVFNIMRQFSLTAILAVGMGLIIITGGIDLSVGSVIAMSACLGGFVAKELAAPAIVVLLVILATGAGVGLANGTLVAKVGIPPFIATLGMLSIGKGVALLLTNGSPIKYEPTWISVFGGSYIGAMPVSVLVMVVVVVLGFVFANYTQIGRNIYAVGNSERAAKLSGIMVDKVIMLVYTLTGLLAGLCGLLLIGQLNAADQSYGSGYELDVIAAAVIGGISMSGGEGNILGVMLGAALMGVLKNMFIQLAVSGYWQTIILGFVIIGAVAIDSVRKKRATR